MRDLLIQNWDKIMELLRTEYDIKKISFDAWLKHLKFKDLSGNKVIIISDADNAASNINFIQKRYGAYIKSAIMDVMDYEFDIEIVANESAPAAAVQPEVRNTANNRSSVKLNPNYTFDNFVVSRSNSMVYAAALKVAEDPGHTYNPLYIYGNPGLGKTHLMHSIAQFIIENSPELRVMYVTSDTFTNELIDSIRHGTISPSDFRDKYRNIDVLLIDDIQFIIGKASTQEEFFNTFNYLYDENKQIVISSDKPPRDFNDLEERFRSRFEAGLIEDIQTPDFETKMAILKKKLEIRKFENISDANISDECLAFIADNINTNVRSLEGALTKILAYARINHLQNITLPDVEHALRDMIFPNQKKVLTVSFITEVVAEHFDISVADIMSPKRDKYIAQPRQIVMYLARKYTDYTSTDIAKALQRDHSTVQHGSQIIEDKIKTDPELASKIDIIVKKLNIEE